MTIDLYQPPLVAILRGLAIEDAARFGAILFDAGFRIIEVPLNRTGALQCIATLVAMAPADALIGGGTMLSVESVEQVSAAGARLMVAPNCNPAVIQRARALNMICAPGVATPTEAFVALQAGAQVLKLFPAEVIGPRGLAAMKSVLPDEVPLWPVGGITPDSLDSWRSAGAGGVGIGSQLFKPGITAAALRERARAFMDAWGARA